MAYLKQDELFKIIISSAIKDRVDFVACLCDDDPLMAETKDFIKRMKIVAGLTFKSAMAEDKEAVRLACLSAESWWDNVADVYGKGSEFKRANSLFKKVVRLRRQFFGITKLESMRLSGAAMDIRKIIGLHQ